MLGIGYLYFYINGYFGEALFDWSFLSDLLVSFIHPIALIGLVPFLIIVYVRRRKDFILGFDNMQKSIKGHLIVILVSTVLIISMFIVEKQLALVYAFLYFFIIGFFSSYLLGMRLFEIKNEVEPL
jgi:predicted neutral ceramidase superfamily lipid hydrolase